MTPTQAQIDAAKVLAQLKNLYTADGDTRDAGAIAIIAAALTAAAEAAPKQAEIPPPSGSGIDVARAEAAAAEVGLKNSAVAKFVEATTIERCAQVADNFIDPRDAFANLPGKIAAAIRALATEGK